jgi:hypothetical protein
MMCPVMIRDARRSLEEHASHQGLDLAFIDPAGAVDVMIHWYETVGADDAAPSDEDGDGLLFQWGTYEFEEPRTFQYNLTRQLISYEDDEQVIWQLSLTLHYEPSTESGNLRGDRTIWCFARADIPAWRAAVRASAASSYVARRRPVHAAVTFEQVC